MAKFHFDAINDIEKLLKLGFNKKVTMRDAKNARFEDALRIYKEKKNIKNFKILLYIFLYNKEKKCMVRKMFL